MSGLVDDWMSGKVRSTEYRAGFRFQGSGQGGCDLRMGVLQRVRRLVC
jgi:hypothetical protein